MRYVLHSLSSVHSHLQTLVSQGRALRMKGFLLLVGWKGEEPLLAPLIVPLLADWRASAPGWGFWVGRDDAGSPGQTAEAAAVPSLQA